MTISSHDFINAPDTDSVDELKQWFSTTYPDRTGDHLSDVLNESIDAHIRFTAVMNKHRLTPEYS